jgi:hypothetical protein
MSWGFIPVVGLLPLLASGCDLSGSEQQSGSCKVFGETDSHFRMTPMLSLFQLCEEAQDVFLRSSEQSKKETVSPGNQGHKSEESGESHISSSPPAGRSESDA